MNEKRGYHKKGNPFKRGETWTFIYYITDKDGKRKQKWKGGYATKEEAEQALKEYEAKSLLGQYIPTDRITVEEYLVGWFDLHKLMLEPSTINGYRVNIYNHIIPAIGRIPLKDLRVFHVERMYIDLQQEKHLSGKTIKYVHNVLKVALKDAVKNKLLAENVCADAKTPKVAKYQSKLLTQEQMQELFAAVTNTRYETAIKLATVLGLRRGEVLGLKFSDYNPTMHSITIQRQISVVRTKKAFYDVKDLKTECSHRVLFLSEDMEQLIERQRIYNEAQKKALGSEYHDNGFICCKDNGEHANPQTLYHAFKRILEKSGLPDIRFHDLRHSYATLLIDLNIPIKVISQNLGHSSTAVTDSVYADSIRAKQNVSNVVSASLSCTRQNTENKPFSRQN